MEILNSIKETVLKTLYEYDAVKINVETPFTLKGGTLSPVYCDAASLENDPITRSRVGSSLLFWLNSQCPEIDAVVGVVSGGISWATMLANNRLLPLLRAHATRKEHGLKNQVDGKLPIKSIKDKDVIRVWVIDDVITSGNSVLSVVRALQEKGLNGKKVEVAAVCVIFDWDFPKVNEQFNQAGINKMHLTSLSEVMDYGFKNNLLPQEAEEPIKKFYEEHC